MKTLQRSQAIQVLRGKCLALVDDEHSLCKVVSDLKILCGGFSQWSFEELKGRFDWIVKNRPHITRRELEDLANRWNLAREYVCGSELSCDQQLTETHHRVCRGWDEFSEEDLARFVEELTGDRVQVVPDAAPSKDSAQAG